MLGQNMPVTVLISSVNSNGGKIFFFAPVPYESDHILGLTIGALVSGSMTTFNSSSEVAAATLYGPALIEVG